MWEREEWASLVALVRCMKPSQQLWWLQTARVICCSQACDSGFIIVRLRGLVLGALWGRLEFRYSNDRFISFGSVTW